MPLFELGFPVHGKSHTAQAQLTEQGLFPKAAGHRQILGFVFIPGLKNTPCSPLGTPQGLLWSKKLWKRIPITSFPQTEAPSCPITVPTIALIQTRCSKPSTSSKDV